MSGPESGLVAKIATKIQKQHPTAWVFKVHGSPYQRAGVPDLLVALDGFLYGLEVKFPHPGESREAREARVTLVQRAEMERMNRAGVPTAMVDSVDEALAFLPPATNS